MLETGEQPESEPDANETADGVYAEMAAGLEAAGIRSDVAAILRDTMFVDADPLAAATAAMERLSDLPEGEP